MLEGRKIGNAAEQMEALKLENERFRKELEGERKANEFLEKECNRYKELAEARGENNKKFDEENKKIKAENKRLQAEKQCLTSIKDKALEESKEYQRKYVFLKNQFDNNIKVIEDYSAKITILEEDNKEYKRANEGLAAESKERLQTIKKLQSQIEDNTENAILRNKVEVLENQLENELGRNRVLKEKVRKYNYK